MGQRLAPPDARLGDRACMWPFPGFSGTLGAVSVHRFADASDVDAIRRQLPSGKEIGGMANLKDKWTGRFIVLDGPDGSGKGTQLKLLADALEAEGVPVVLGKDPGGTEVGDRIRALLLQHDLTGMDPRCETLLFMASRAQLVTEVIAPALTAGKTVL